MKLFFLSSAVATAFIVSGCANREGVAPSQNHSLNAISPSTTATSEGGTMQRSLDAWLKEEWSPITNTVPVSTKASNDSKSEDRASKTSAPEKDESFTLQKYADKWKVYHENKAKMEEGKPKEPSHVEQMQSLPVVGK